MSSLQSAPLGKLLVDTGVVSRAALDEVLAAQRIDKRRLGELLVERGLVRPQQLAQVLSHQLSCPWVALQRFDIAPAVLTTLPRDLVLEHEVVPVYLRSVGVGRRLYVATADPTDEVVLGACARAAGLSVKPMVALTSDIRAALTRYYGAPEPIPSPSVAPPPPPKAAPRIEPETLDDAEVLAVVEEAPAELRRATILLLNAPERFVAQCRTAIADLDALLVDGTLARAGELVLEHKPCAIVVTEEVYAFERSGLNKVALDHDAVLVVWTEDAESKQLEPLLGGAIKRWRRGAYEKGTVLDGRYELLRDLGGPVLTSRWEVRHAKTGRRAILHVASAGAKGGKPDPAGVRRQRKALSRITHPGAVDLRDAGTTEGGDAFIVLESLEGKSLEGLLAARGKLPLRDVWAVFLQVANVLAEAHAVGVLHGDVRLENVVLVRDGYGVERAKLTGWQAAQVSEGAVNGRSDLAAFGTCLFEAITGRAPSGDGGPASGVPADVAKVLERALARDGEAKFEDARALALAIDKALPLSREPSELLEARRLEDATPGTDKSEQRRFPRAPYRTPVRLEVPGIGAIDGRTEDISARGLFVVARANIAPGTAVTVRFALPVDGKVVGEAAVVRWSRAARAGESLELWAIGVELASPTAETYRQVDRYVSLMGDSSEPT